MELTEEQYALVGACVAQLLRRKSTTNKGVWSKPRYLTSVGSYTDVGLGKLVTRIVEEAQRGGQQTKWD